METIRAKQVRVLRRSIMNGKLYTRENDCIGYLKTNPLGKDLKAIEFKHRKRPERMYGQVVEVRGSKFEEVTIDFGHTSQTLHVILKDNKIIYFTFSNIYAPASSAFETLTEVTQGYYGNITTHFSTHDCKVYDHQLNIFTKLSGKQRIYPTEKVKDNSKRIDKLYYHY